MYIFWGINLERKKKKQNFLNYYKNNIVLKILKEINKILIFSGSTSIFLFKFHLI